MPDADWGLQLHPRHPGDGELSDSRAIDHFSDELDRLVDRFRSEYEAKYAEIVGCLAMKAHLLMNEAEDREDELET